MIGWSNWKAIECLLSSQPQRKPCCLIYTLFIFATCAAEACSQNVVGAQSDASEIRSGCLLQLSWSQRSSKLSDCTFCHEAVFIHALQAWTFLHAQCEYAIKRCKWTLKSKITQVTKGSVKKGGIRGGVSTYTNCISGTFWSA